MQRFPVKSLVHKVLGGGGEKVNGITVCTVCTHEHRHPPALCEQGFLPENIACLSV
jgi:hypothetical protein